jgi:integrase
MLAKTPRKLTDEWIADQPFAAEGPVVIADPQVPGHRIVIRKRVKSFEVQKERPERFGPRKTHVVKVGRAPYTKLSEARERAIIVIGKIEKGEDPHEAEKVVAGEMTFAEAWAAYRASLVKRPASPATLAVFDRCYTLLEPIHHKTLRALSDEPAIAKREHERITAKVLVEGKGRQSRGGPGIADLCMRFLSATYSNARRKLVRGLPADSPTSAVDPNAAKPDVKAMSSEDLPRWFEQWRDIKNPIQKEAALFLLLSGLRRTDGCSVRWEDVDLKRRVLHRPKPKGGASKAFDLPLSDAMLRCLWRARKAGRVLYPDSPWAFPAASRAGYIEQMVPLEFSGHDLRRSFATIAETDVGVPEETVGRLLNHSRGKNITRIYTRSNPQLRFLREMQEQISRHIIMAGVPDVRKRFGMGRR